MDPVLELSGVSKSYEGFFLREVSFSLPRGYIMGLIGPNGAGKTTLLKMVLDLVRPDAGEIRVFGRDAQREGKAIRARVGFVHEEPAFYRSLPAERVAEIVGGFYPTWDGGTFRALAEEFGVPLGRRLKAFSHGMRTRFALCLALAHEAELLLLDEPSSGLDPAFRRDLLDRLSGVIEGGVTSVLFSTHITSDLDRIADYVTFLRDGELQFATTRDEVLERYALVKGDPELLTGAVRPLLVGVVKGDLGFVGLTNDVDGVRSALQGKSFVLDRATLEDVVFFTGRTGEGGMRFHAE
jgi:ABC-2 type transport system ATP-binding protein